MKRLTLVFAMFIVCISFYIGEAQTKERIINSYVPLANNVDSAQQNHYIHQINPKVWFPKNIRWPSDEKKVHVYFNKDIDPSECRELKQNAVTFFSQKDKYGQLDFGESCNKLIVLFNEKKLEKVNKFKEFLTAHEAFHIAVQFYGKSMVVAMFDVGDSYNHVKDFYYLLDFISLLKKTYLDTNQHNLNKHCDALNQYVNELSKQQRDILLTRAMYEWPAEYYAKQVVFGKNDKEYLSIRNHIRNSDEEKGLAKDIGMYWEKFYIMSHPIIKEIEKNISTLEWQVRIAEGESILDIYLKQKNCTPLTDTWVQIYVKFKPLLVAKKNIELSLL